jgi:hypothetical protein
MCEIGKARILSCDDEYSMSTDWQAFTASFTEQESALNHRQLSD